MGEWLESLLPWGTAAILWAQSLSTGWLDAVFTFFTYLGYEQFYLVILPFVYWCVHKEAGIALGTIAMLSAWANSVLKNTFDLPRPSDPRLHVPLPESDPSFPSGHAQNAVANWGYLALYFRKRLLWVAAAVLVVGISLSRIVLGVHFPQDVVGGLLLGGVLLAVYSWAAPPAGRWLVERRPAVQVILSVAVPLGLILLHPSDTEGLYPAGAAITPMSALLGLAIGAIMERAWVRFRVEGPWQQRALRLVVGLIVALVFYGGPKLLLPEALPHSLEAVLRFVRYALLGWIVAFVCPWLFVRFRLAEQESDLPSGR